MNEFQFGDGKFFVLAFQIRHLSADELQRAARMCEFNDEVPVRIARPALGLRGDLKRLRQQRVARQHGNAFAENFVVGRLAAAEIVVVHRRQIVVDERVGVDALDGARERHGGRVAATTSLGGSQQNCRAHPLAAGEERVAHGFVNRRGLGLLAGQEFVERAVDGIGARSEELVQVERFWCGHARMF